MFNLEEIKEEVEVRELANRFPNHLRRDLLVHRYRVVVVFEAEALPRQREDAVEAQVLRKFEADERGLVTRLDLGAREGPRCEEIPSVPGGKRWWPPRDEHPLEPQRPDHSPKGDKLLGVANVFGSSDDVDEGHKPRLISSR
jgi:hypothetical protein